MTDQVKLLPYKETTDILSVTTILLFSVERLATRICITIIISLMSRLRMHEK